ncbi:spore coat protein GerQ [Heyndrickxia coagulans]|nr:spore coat protein GerQ [Heyndrickxia coagulans]UJZ87402.1 spore coat protein GerQ [Heyndrickxia coagulans]
MPLFFMYFTKTRADRYAKWRGKSVGKRQLHTARIRVSLLLPAVRTALLRGILSAVPGSRGQQAQAPSQNLPGQLPLEQSYIENILRLNKGKLITLYATFENNREWNAKVFNGIIEAAGRDHVILSDPQTGKRYLIPMVYVDYIVFSEEIEYEYPYGAPQAQQLATYPPRG